MRKVFHKLHLWLSIPLGVFLSLICLTGAILVFETEIKECMSPELYRVEVKEGEVKLSPSQLAAAVMRQVPDTLEELVKLPGVGRKTANVIQSVVFHKAAMAVDTHVFRVSHRIGLVPGTCTTPLATEKHLTRYIPEALIPKAHHWLILHGRYVCTARNPKCDKCGLNGICQASLKAKI